MMLRSYAQVKDPFKVYDRQIDVIGMSTEHSVIYSFRFYIATNLQVSTSCWVFGVT